MNSPVDSTAMVGRSAAGEKMSLNKLKHSVTLERRYNAKYNSKYRHKPFFSNSNGHRVIAGLPVWASVLILIAIVIVALFIVGLIVGFIRGECDKLPTRPFLSSSALLPAPSNPLLTHWHQNAAAP
jgi:hypothetical protein